MILKFNLFSVIYIRVTPHCSFGLIEPISNCKFHTEKYQEIGPLSILKIENVGEYKF